MACTKAGDLEDNLLVVEQKVLKLQFGVAQPFAVAIKHTLEELLQLCTELKSPVLEGDIG